MTSVLQPGRIDTADDGSTGRFEPARWPTLALAVVAIVVGEILTWLLLRSQGNVITGDSPHYLIAAQTLSHLSVHVLPQYRTDLATHYIYAWPQGATLSTMGVHAFTGPHGVIFAQGIGLPALLTPFIALGNVPLALLAFFTVNAIGFVSIHQRASLLAGLGRNGQLVFALALACPALWLAATQIYPDLISGIFLACGLIEMALVERSGTWRWTSVAVITVALAVPPWFQVKNFSVDVVAILGLLALLYLRRIALAPALVVIGVVLASFVLLLVYNQYYFGHLLGLPQPSPNFGTRGLKDTIGLVLDRDQGLLVQCPTVLFGLLGLWYSPPHDAGDQRRALLGALAILVINGTQPITTAFGGHRAGRPLPVDRSAASPGVVTVLPEEARGLPPTARLHRPRGGRPLAGPGHSDPDRGPQLLQRHLRPVRPLGPDPLPGVVGVHQHIPAVGRTDLRPSRGGGAPVRSGADRRSSCGSWCGWSTRALSNSSAASQWEPLRSWCSPSWPSSCRPGPRRPSR